MGNKLEERVSEMKRALIAASKKSEDLLKRRDHLNQKNVEWNEKKTAYHAQEQELQENLAKLKEQSSEGLMEGKDPQTIFQEQREISAKIEFIQDALKEIEGNILPHINEEIKQAQESVINTMRGVIARVISEYQEKLDKKLKDFIEVDLLAWSKANGEFVQEMEIPGNLEFKLRITNRTVERAII